MTATMLRSLLKLNVVCLVLTAACAMPETGPVEIASPDGRVRLEFRILDGPDGPIRPVYSITFGDVAVIENSGLGIELRGAKPIGPDLKITGVSRKKVDQTYPVVHGKSAQARDHYSEARINLKEVIDPSREFALVVRVFDDGVGFRYLIPEQDSLDSFEILDERTEFRFTDNYSCVALDLGRYTSNYETEFKTVKLADIAPASIVGLPLLVKVNDNLWAAIAEADLTDYAGMYLSGIDGSPAGLVSNLSPLPDGGGVRVRADAPLATPWRVVMLADDAGRLIESNIIINLNDPCEIEDTSWIQPGKAAWPWWSGEMVTGVDFEGGMNTATLKHYTDFAAEMGLEYLLVDAGWYGDHRDPTEDITTWIDDVDMPEVISYAGERGVKVLLWINWGCAQRQMDVAFPLYHKWGVAGIKVDYMNRDDQEMVRYYHHVIRTAAENQLTVDFHGAYKPTGIRRTWPNLLTREGVLGLEYVKWSDRAEPEHNVTIPFTRMLVGPMDYTPGAFRNVTRQAFQAVRRAPMAPGTRAHQLAMFVVYESPLQMCVDYPGSYRGQPGVDFLKVVPATWDETRVLKAAVGDCITIARRKGGDWFIGSMNDWTRRRYDISLDFLGKGGFTARLFTDAADADRFPTHLAITERAVIAGDSLEVSMAPGGGQAVWIQAQ